MTLDKADELLKNEKLKRTEKYLNSGAIICIDDFERKSKDIDLNDLFGFITQLTLNFECKVIIILNDDVFEGEDKKIFTNVKEKTVSKFLYYNPTIEELFKLIFYHTDKYKVLSEFEDYILEVIEETKILNARIYTQVLDNLSEWFNNNQTTNNIEILRCIVLVNINFILYHQVAIIIKENKENRLYELRDFHNKGFTYDKNRLSERLIKTGFGTFDEYITYAIYRITSDKNTTSEYASISASFIEENRLLFKCEFFINKLDIARDISEDLLTKINNFIETGILINE
jgi:hypothetical protein